MRHRINVGLLKLTRGEPLDVTRSPTLACAASVAIRLARSDRRHDRYSCGLHHLAWVAQSREDVDHLYELLVGIGATILDPPADYPHYRDGYYALFFADPDGLKLEFVHTPPDQAAA